MYKWPSITPTADETFRRQHGSRAVPEKTTEDRETPFEAPLAVGK